MKFVPTRPRSARPRPFTRELGLNIGDCGRTGAVVLNGGNGTPTKSIEGCVCARQRWTRSTSGCSNVSDVRWTSSRPLLSARPEIQWPTLALTSRQRALAGKSFRREPSEIIEPSFFEKHSQTIYITNLNTKITVVCKILLLSSSKRIKTKNKYIYLCRQWPVDYIFIRRCLRRVRFAKYLFYLQYLESKQVPMRNPVSCHSLSYLSDYKLVLSDCKYVHWTRAPMVMVEPAW